MENLCKTIFLVILVSLVQSRPQQLRGSRLLPAAGAVPRALAIPSNAAPASPVNLEQFQRNTGRNLGLEEVPSEYDQVQNANAQYEFSSNVEDHINDQSQRREEVRDGVNVKGMYSYSDGYFKRTVHYAADEQGFRITGMETEPLDGPHVDPSGVASVQSYAHGIESKYKVASVPAPEESSRILAQ